MGAVDFLKKKREEQKHQSQYNTPMLAPSPAARHGLDMGGYQVQSGQYTGNGPDGIVQPQLPTQRRIDSRGDPYVVDEGELLVVDAKTLKDYGGAAALDEFLQKNRPQGNGGGDVYQMACGGRVPHQRQYSTGGVPSAPTRPRMFAGSEQLKMLDEIKNGLDRYQQGGSPSARPIKEQVSPQETNRPRPFQRPGGDSGKRPIYPDTPLINKPVKPKSIIDPITAPDVKPLDSNLVPSITAPDLKPTGIKDIVAPITAPETTPVDMPQKVDPITAPEVTPLDMPAIQAPAQPEQPQPGKPPVVSPSEYDEMMLNRYLSRQGAMSESERAAEAQRGLQAGMSDREVAGRGAISDVSRRAAMGDTTAQFAMDAAKREEERDKFQQGMSLQEKQMQLQKDKFDYGKKMDQVGMLIAQGGADNFQKASEIMKESFGNSVDFSNALQAENLGNFNNGFNNMNAAIASGMSFDDWVKTAQADGTLAAMNMTEGDLQSMYNNMKMQSDPLFQTISMIDSWVENKLIDAEAADGLKEIMSHQLTNPEGFEIANGYQILDKNGNEVGFFTDEAEANKFIETNKDKEYTSNFVENHIGMSDKIQSGFDEIDTTTLGQEEKHKISKLLGRPPTKEEANMLFSDSLVADAVVNNNWSGITMAEANEMKDLYDRMPDDYKEKNKFSSWISKVDPEEGRIMEAMENGEVVSSYTYGDTEYSLQDIMGKDFSKWTKYGKNHWVFDKKTKQFLNDNKGKYLKMGNKTWKLKSFSDGHHDDRHSYPSITIEDPITGETIKIASKQGKVYMDGYFGKLHKGEYSKEMELTHLNDLFDNEYWGEESLTFADKQGNG